MSLAFKTISLMACILVMVACSTASAATGDREFDVIIYGGTSGGVTAAVQAARMGKRAALIEPSKHLGGVSSGGLGWTDIGNPEVVGGLSREFYHRVFQFYQSEAAWKYGTREQFAGAPGQQTTAVDPKRELMWVFEPHAAEKAFDDLIREANVT